MNLTQPASTLWSIETISGTFTSTTVSSTTNYADPDWASAGLQNIVTCNTGFGPGTGTMNSNTKWKVTNLLVGNNIHSTSSTSSKYQTEQWRQLYLWVGVANKNQTSYAWLAQCHFLPAGSAFNFITAENPIWLRYDDVAGQASRIGIRWSRGYTGTNTTTDFDKRLYWHCTYEIWGTDT